MGNEPSTPNDRPRRFSRQGSSRKSMSESSDRGVANQADTPKVIDEEAAVPNETIPEENEGENNEMDVRDEEETKNDLHIAETDDSETTEHVSNLTNTVPKKWTPDTADLAPPMQPMQPGSTDDSDPEQPPDEDEASLDKVICAKDETPRPHAKRTIQCLHGVACISAVSGIALFVLAGVCGWGGYCGL